MQVTRERLLIVNADDLGMSPGVTHGIIALAQAGAVTSTSALVNMPASRDGLAAARDAGLDTGLHLNISTGYPLSPPEQVPSLVDADGRFVRVGELLRRRLRGALRVGDVAREWSAQIERIIAAGIAPSHLDSHCHVHMTGALYGLFMRLARHYGIPGVRLRLAGYVVPLPGHVMIGRASAAQASGQPPLSCDHFSVLTNIPSAQAPRGLTSLLGALPPGLHELVCHPGYVDDELRRTDTLTDQREREMLLLSRPLLRRTLEANNLRLVTWSQAITLYART